MPIIEKDIVAYRLALDELLSGYAVHWDDSSHTDGRVYQDRDWYAAMDSKKKIFGRKPEDAEREERLMQFYADDSLEKVTIHAFGDEMRPVAKQMAEIAVKHLANPNVKIYYQNRLTP